MKCPNCGTEIGRFELRANCKKCGINLFYSQQEQLLSEDAKRCELEFASMRIFVSKLKAAFIAGALPRLRIVLIVLSIVALLVPVATMKTDLPLFSHTFTVSGLGLYNGFSDGSLMAMLDVAKLDDPTIQSIAAMALVSIGSLLLTALAVVVLFVTELLSFVNMKRSAKAMVVLSAVGMVFCVASVIIGFLFKGTAGSITAITVKAGFGSLVSFLVFAAMMAVNLLIIKKNLSPAINQIDLDRIAMRKRIKAGEITYAELPLPVFETEEEREARLRFEAESQDEGAVSERG